MIKLEAKSLGLAYGRNVVVENLTFQVMPGEMVGLIGPNGSGKSTIIKALSRVISPLSGQILLDGKDISQIPRRDLARLLGVVPQMPLLPNAFSAFEIVLMGRNPHLGLLQYEGARDMSITWQCVNISDIAAMGGVPRYATISLGMPKTLDAGFLDALYGGLRAAGRRFNVNIVGGDTNRSDRIIIDVAIIGEVKRKDLLLRSGAGEAGIS